MKKDITPGVPSSPVENENTPSNTGMNRRKFVELTASAAIGFSIDPGHHGIHRAI